MALNKSCSICFEIKPISSFSKRTNGIRTYCKSCAALKLRDWRTRNPALVKAGRKFRYQATREKVLTENAAWRAKNRDAFNAYERKRYAKNPKRYHENIQFKLATNLRNRLRTALKNRSKKGSAIALLGCSVDQAIRYIESKFQNGMSWENHGEWHIDHKKPLASFDLEDSFQLSAACHYTNLQPLWAIDNLKKGAHVI